MPMPPARSMGRGVDPCGQSRRRPRSGRRSCPAGRKAAPTARLSQTWPSRACSLMLSSEPNSSIAAVALARDSFAFRRPSERGSPAASTRARKERSPPTRSQASRMRSSPSRRLQSLHQAQRRDAVAADRQHVHRHQRRQRHSVSTRKTSVNSRAERTMKPAQQAFLLFGERIGAGLVRRRVGLRCGRGRNRDGSCAETPGGRQSPAGE